jgi:hypothetical protein
MDVELFITQTQVLFQRMIFVLTVLHKIIGYIIQQLINVNVISGMYKVH